MGTVAGVNTRRYHALLIASLSPPADRFAILSRVEETAQVGGQTFALATVQYPGVVQPHGFDLLEEFRIDPFPTWRYGLAGVDIQKIVCLIDGQQSVLVRYFSNAACRLSVRFFTAFRDYHSLAHQSSDVSFETNVQERAISVLSHTGLPPLTLIHSNGTFQPDTQWFLNNEYLRELERGLDFKEDLYSPGTVAFDLLPERGAWFIATVEADKYPGSLDDAQINSLLSAESQRRVFETPLTRAVDQFRVMRADAKPSLLAGYPWFTDWGRDILISLPALQIAGFPASETKAILTLLLEQRSQGVLPNRFTDERSAPEYNTVDATLWLFAAAHDFLKRTRDFAFLREILYPAARDILDWHFRGTYYNIAVDPEDHLLFAGAPGVQLTWMDAKIGGHVVTPRTGKAVEINALWYNALCITSAWAAVLQLPDDSARYAALAAASHASFEQKFWNPELSCLYDVLTQSGADASVRPNQLFAVSLPFPLLDNERARSVVNTVRDNLLTRTGLRTLSPQDSAYRPRFEGDMVARDSAYHQGTVWPWLLGPFIGAYLYAFGETAESLAFCREILQDMERELNACCLGSISEVYDGDEPRYPGGCPAQLWSVAQLIIAKDRSGSF